MVEINKMTEADRAELQVPFSMLLKGMIKSVEDGDIIHMETAILDVKNIQKSNTRVAEFIPLIFTDGKGWLQMANNVITKPETPERSKQDFINRMKLLDEDFIFSGELVNFDYVAEVEMHKAAIEKEEGKPFEQVLDDLQQKVNERDSVQDDLNHINEGIDEIKSTFKSKVNDMFKKIDDVVKDKDHIINNPYVKYGSMFVAAVGTVYVLFKLFDTSENGDIIILDEGPAE